MTDVGVFGCLMFIAWNTQKNQSVNEKQEKNQSIDTLEKWGTYVWHSTKWNRLRKVKEKNAEFMC